MKKKSFDVKVTVSLQSEHVAFLEELIKSGEAENLSQAIRKCINITRKGVTGGGKGYGRSDGPC